MARPKKSTVEYFPHYVHHHKTMFTIEAKFGNDGYAFWFKLLELLGASDNHYLDCNEVETWEYLLAKTHLDEVTANNILSLLANLSAIDKDLWQHKIIWSENFLENLNTVYNRRDLKPLQKSDIMGLMQTKTPLKEITADINPQSKVKESKVEESKVEESKAPTKTIVLGEPDFIDEIIEKFQQAYKETRQVDYDVLSRGKERKAAASILKLYRAKYPKAKSNEALNGLYLYFKSTCLIKDDWLNRNMSPSIIVSKFNEINQTLKNGNTTSKLSKAGALLDELYGQ